VSIADPSGLNERADLRPAFRQVAGAGRVCFWHGGSVWIGRSVGRTEWHDHHAIQIALALDGVCLFRGASDSAWTEFDGAIVRSHRHHQFEADGVTVAQLFVEPESAEGRALRERFAADIAPLPEAQRASMTRLMREVCADEASADAVVAAARAAIAELAGSAAPRLGFDPRVAKAIEHVRAHLRAPLSLADAAAAAALSPSRLRHLFVQQTGTAFRAYVLWLRLLAATEAAMAGASWTQAAHEAGFADSAHLSRTFKRMFGVVPATLMRP
jgi:AraC family transcriptional regulator